MADSGISGVFSGMMNAVLAPRSVRVSPLSAVSPVSLSGQGGVGGGSTTDTYRAPGQVINIDGQSFDRTARRGTYLDILA
jgi:hypothetical protein